MVDARSYIVQIMLRTQFFFLIFESKFTLEALVADTKLIKAKQEFLDFFATNLQSMSRDRAIKTTISWNFPSNILRRLWLFFNSISSLSLYKYISLSYALRNLHSFIQQKSRLKCFLVLADIFQASSMDTSLLENYLTFDLNTAPARNTNDARVCSIILILEIKE